MSDSNGNIDINKMCVNNERNNLMKFFKNTRSWDILFRHRTSMGLSRKIIMMAVTAATSIMFPKSILAKEFTMVANIPYIENGGSSQIGNLYLPNKVDSTTPMVLTIHGGAWAGGDRASWRGVSEYFVKELGYAAFNIEYRLAGDNARWPTCGDDCVAAAQYILSDEFKRQYGFSYDKIWICGGSAGGHLALWALVKLPANKVAGCVAISPIGDPMVDYAKNPSRYTPLFGDALNLDAMNPCLHIETGMAPVLITHATEDRVVSIESSKKFADAYRAAGNKVEYFEYPCDLEPNEAGHCIWRPDSSPHRLINSLECKIAFFAGNHKATNEWTARAMDVASINRRPIGTVESVDLRFGHGNGLTNRLYLAYGETYGGDHIVDWEHVLFISEVTDDMTSICVNVPISRNYKFFLDVPFPGNKIGVPVSDIIGTGTQYIDTGVKLRGGDSVRVRVKPASNNRGVILGSRGSNANDRNIQVTYISKGYIVDYNSSSYEPYRLQTEPYNENTNRWVDIVASPEERFVKDVVSGEKVKTDTDVCLDQFETCESCWLYFTSGAAVINDKFSGSISSFEIGREGFTVASYVPYRFGEKYGFFDRVTGIFITAVEGSGDFLGTEDKSMTTPLTSSTETIRSGKSTVEIPPRTISSYALVNEGDDKYIDLIFGADNGLQNKLYLAYDLIDRGDTPSGWSQLEYLGVVSSETNTWRVSVPEKARHCRFFVALPTDGNTVPIALGSIRGNGSGYFDTGYVIKGGDAIYARVKPVTQGLIFGYRHSMGSANDRNVTVTFRNKSYFIDYNSSNYAPYRLTTDANSGNVNRWVDIVASPEERSVTDVISGSKIGVNSTVCRDKFMTSENCWLFAVSGNPVTQDKFDGEIASFKIARDGGFITSLTPCRIGTEYGFYDRVNAKFIIAETGTFSGIEDSSVAPLYSVTDDIMVRGFFVISFR